MVKSCRSMLDSIAPVPAWVACNVMMPGAVGITVKTPAEGPVIVAVPTEPDTTVRAITRPELAEGVTVNCWPTDLSAMAAKLTDCSLVLVEPAM